MPPLKMWSLLAMQLFPNTLPCKHYLYVSIPEKLAKHIQDSISRVGWFHAGK
jgi:hypothetical protein